MMNRTLTLVVLIALVWGAPSLAAPSTAEARGVVQDQDGNPVQGVVVRFTPTSNADTTYDGKTNKKGRYLVPGMFSGQGDTWHVELQAEGMLPTKMTVESRTVNRVLVGEVYTAEIKPGMRIPDVTIRPMGSAEINFTIAPAEQVMQSVPAADAPGDPAQTAAAAPAAPVRSAWDTALSLVRDGNLEGALEHFDKAIENKPEDAELRRTLAKVLYQLERFADAVPQAAKASELDPANLESRMVLYSAQVATGDLDGAKATLVATRERFPADVRVLRQLAYVAGEQGHTQEAIAAYEEVVAIKADDSEAWLALANLYAGSGALDKSEQAYERVVALDPDEAHQVFYNIGALIMNKPTRSDGETERAISAFRKALELNPNYVQAHKQLAFALLGTGDRAGAKSELEAYVRLAPNAPDSKQMEQLLKTLQ